MARSPDWETLKMAQGDPKPAWPLPTVMPKFATWSVGGGRPYGCPTEKCERFAKRFNGQPDTPHYHRQQCRQLMTNDYENSLPPTKPKKEDWREKWRAVL